MKRILFSICVAAIGLSVPAYGQNDETVFDFVEVQPTFPGGQQALFQYIAAHITYPQEALERGQEGRPVCKFIVNRDSTISDIELVRSCGTKSLDDEALRVISEMPKWNPGMQNGKVVRSRYILPVPFRITPAMRADMGQIFGNDVDSTIFVIVETMPEFPGGQQGLFNYLSKNVHYPEDAKRLHKEGRVICQFVVDIDGRITDVKVLQSAGFPSLDEEAVRVVKHMPRWNPGKQKGKPVRVQYRIPINFSFPD